MKIFQTLKIRHLTVFCLILMTGSAVALARDHRVENWKYDWPKTDFSKSSIDLKDIMDGGPPKDGIPAIDRPRFKPVGEISDIADTEPVISLNINGDVRAYPVRILMFHEIVNDSVGEVPVTITYCPLCNASLVFERTLDGRVLNFGTTGKLRLSDMVMYDRQTESWWQQFTGEGIVGRYSGRKLKVLPSRVESFALFRGRHPDGLVLVPNNSVLRRYGSNPYVKYDSKRWPFLFRGKYNGPVPPLSRLVVVGQQAWPLSLIKKRKAIRYHDLLISWQAGQNSPLDSRSIKKGRDVGNVTVTRDGEIVVYNIPFAFAFKAFYPDGIIHMEGKDDSGK